MNKVIISTLLCLFGLIVPLRADTSVVFNEIMYHPPSSEATTEWIELYNQMAVDVDMSGWSLDGDIHYRFPSNTVVHGGAFVVVAISPTNLAAMTGLTNVFGPYTNQLPNNTGQLLLRNNNGRVVNEMDYDQSGAWPVAPDGSGVSLAKIDHSAGSSQPENWTYSAQMGGTPGRENFPTNSTVLPLAFNEVSATTNTSFWIELVNYGTNSLSLAGYVIVRNGPTNGEYVLPAGPSLAAGGYLAISNASLGSMTRYAPRRSAMLRSGRPPARLRRSRPIRNSLPLAAHCTEPIRSRCWPRRRGCRRKTRPRPSPSTTTQFASTGW